MNTRLLRRVAKHIAAEPKRLAMHLIATTVDSDAHNAPPCRTVGCIAGWSCLLSGETVDKSSWSKGRNLLGLDEDASYRLFDYPANLPTDGWPKKFVKRFMNARTPRGRATVTVARIEHFIKTKGAE